MKSRNFLRRMKKDERLLWQAGIVILAGSVALGVLTYLGAEGDAAELVTTPVEERAPAPDAFANVWHEGKAAIVYDLKTGEVLYEKNAEAQLPLASLTKLLTIYAAADILSDTTPITIDAEALAVEGESGFFLGETFLFKDLARLALVSSSNDASAAIASAAGAAKGVAGSSLMASAAQAAHLSQTYAVNGTGLDVDLEVSGGYGSAHDVAVLAGELLKKAPHLARATTESSVTVTSVSGMTHTQENTNQGVITVPGVLLSKTGFTDLAGGNLVVVFDAGIDHPVAVVVLGSSREGRFTDVNRLMKATLAHFAGIAPS